MKVEIYIPVTTGVYSGRIVKKVVYVEGGCDVDDLSKKLGGASWREVTDV